MQDLCCGQIGTLVNQDMNRSLGYLHSFAWTVQQRVKIGLIRRPGPQRKLIKRIARIVLRICRRLPERKLSKPLGYCGLYPSVGSNLYSQKKAPIMDRFLDHFLQGVPVNQL